MGLIEILRDRVGRPVEPSGADLYRLNCQSCHRAEGTGSPPEIKSVLGLVQGSPLELVRQHLQKEGTPSAGSAARAGHSSAGRSLPANSERRPTRIRSPSRLGDIVAGAFAQPDRVGNGDYLPLVGDFLSFNEIVDA